MQVVAPPSVAVFAVVYLHWLQAKEVQELSSAALRVWLALLATAAGKPSSNAYLSQISESTGLGETAIRKAFRELENAGLIQRHKGAGWGSPGRRSNGYELLSPPSTRDAEAAAGKVLYSKPEQVESSTQGAGHTRTRGAGHTRTQGAGTQDLSQDLSVDTHTRLPQAVARKCARCGAKPGQACSEKCIDPLLESESKRLVMEWLRYIRRIERAPWPSELKLAREWIASEGTDQAFSLVRSASQELETRGGLTKLYSFCGLQSVVGRRSAI